MSPKCNHKTDRDQGSIFTEEKVAGNGRGVDWNDVPISQGRPAATKTQKKQEIGLPFETLE
jgi:hypothetical protein